MLNQKNKKKKKASRTMERNMKTWFIEKCQAKDKKK